MQPRSTLEQWAVLKAVVDAGSFAAAAQALNRSQSSVSYALARLRDAVGVDLLTPSGRRAVLTAAGAALLDEVAPLIAELARIERRGRGIGAGEAVRIRLVVDSLFPKPRLFEALRALAQAHPHAQVHVIETVRQTVHELPADGHDLAILVLEPGAREADPVADIRLVAVAHPAHPLFAGRQPPSRAALARHVCVEIRGLQQGGEVEGTGRRWLMGTVDSAIDAVRNQLGYGWLPQHLITSELQGGTLRELALGIGQVRHIPLGLYVRDEGEIADAATLALARLLTVGP
ncbi:MAG: LysR family transcriptional regulator [Comamonas sp.]